MPVKLAVASAVFLLIMVVLEILRSKYVLGVTRANIIIPDLPKEFAGMKVALVADLHQMRFSRYNEELARRIKLQEPDYIFFAGDMGDSRKYNVDAFYDLLEILGDDVPLIAAPGNHDLRLGGGGIHRNFAAECEKAGVILLHNSHIELTAGESKVYIYGYCQDLKATPGRDDARKRAAKKRPKKEKIKIKKGKVEIKKEKTVKDKKLRRKNKHWPLKKVTQEDLAEKLGECPADAPVLLVAHDPGGFKKYAKWGAKLVFSGHLHGGLIRVPFLGGLLSPERVFLPRYSAGLHRSGGAQIFVTRGLATGQLFRLLNPPEIALLTLADSADNIPAAKILERVSFAEYLQSERESLGALLTERVNQASDFFAKITGRDKLYSKFSRTADEMRKRHTYTAEDYRKRMGLDEDEDDGGKKKRKKTKKTRK